MIDWLADTLSWLLLGIGSGAVLAALAVGLVLTHQASGVVNFAHAATGVFFARAFYELRESGDLVLPILGLPDRVHVIDDPTVGTAFAVIVPLAAVSGLLIYVAVFRPLSTSPPLARIVASLGLFLYMLAMVADRFPSAPVIRRILPNDSIRLLDRVLFVDRFWLAGLVLSAALGLTLLFRYTRFGLATRASAENQKGAVLLGLDPDLLAAINWMLATVLAAVALILIGSVTLNLDATQFSLLIVPALAAALVGGFRSFAWATVAGLAIGMSQSLLLSWQTEAAWLPDIGLQAGLPFIVIIVTMMVRGESLPSRGSLVRAHFPKAPRPRHVELITIALVAVGVVSLLTLESDWRLAIITSTVWTVIAISVVLLTGWVGQISLAPMAFAGVAAFALIRWSDSADLPFPIAPLLAAVVAMLVGIIVGFPAVRVRGMNLAIATIAAAAAVEELVFKWGWFTGGLSGSSVPPPKIGSIDLGIGTDAASYPRAAFGILCLGTLGVVVIAAAHIRNGETGRRWLAVRSNERAAAAAGIDVTAAKLSAFAISSLIAGLGGTMLAYATGVLSVNSFVVLESLALLAITYLGGIAALSGAFVAGFLADGGLLAQMTGGGASGDATGDAIRGLALIVVAIVYDEGLAGAAGAAWRRVADWGSTRRAVASADG